MDFAYVTFVNNNQNYIDLMKETIRSVEKFSKYKIIVYCIDIPDDNIFSNHEKVIVKHIRNVNLPIIYYYKPYIIIDAIESGLVKHGYYIESDDVITPFCDLIYNIAQKLDILPISPVHPDDVIIPYDNFRVSNVNKTQHYIHAHVLFKYTNLKFLKEWMELCMIYLFYRNADETALNLMYWKYNCKYHYLDIIDPWYECFYTDEKYKKIAYTFHGCKYPHIQKKLLDDMIQYYDNIL